MELLDNGELDEGLEYLEKELADNPKNGYAYSWMAAVYVEKEQYGNAMTYVDKALKYTPKKDKEYMSMAHAIKSRVHYLLGEMDEAEKQANFMMKNDNDVEFAKDELEYVRKMREKDK